MLTGQKGCGKTIDAKLICKEANYPVILISGPIPTDVDFVSYIHSIDQDVVILVDEFEKNFKIYSEDDSDKNYHRQERFLSLMDGFNSKNKRLFVFTTNSSVDSHMMNRPSRIKYVKNYKGISDELAKMVIDDLLLKYEFREDLLENIDKNSCTVDILKSIIEEVNIQDIPYSEFMEDFNFKAESITYDIYSVDGRGTRSLVAKYIDKTNRVEDCEEFGVHSLSGAYLQVHSIEKEGDIYLASCGRGKDAMSLIIDRAEKLIPFVL